VDRWSKLDSLHLNENQIAPVVPEVERTFDSIQRIRKAYYDVSARCGATGDKSAALACGGARL